jgi:hypothetical protein
MKVGVIMMVLTLALVIAAAVQSVALRSEPGRVVPEEVARNSPGQAPRYSSGEESLGYGSSSGGPVRQRKEDAKEPVAAAVEAERSNARSEMPQPADQQTPSEAPRVLRGTCTWQATAWAFGNLEPHDLL